MEKWKPSQTCPACGKQDYLFRGRKKIPSEAGKDEAMVTKYRCKACEMSGRCGRLKQARRRCDALQANELILVHPGFLWVNLSA